MAQACDICGKGVLVGHRISHAHNVSLRRWYPNLRTIRTKQGEETKRLKVCTRCLRSGKVVKAVH